MLESHQQEENQCSQHWKPIYQRQRASVMYCALNIRAWFFTVSCRLRVLTQTITAGKVADASAQSEARISTRQSQRRSSRHQSGFFCCGLSAPAFFMAGLIGLPSGRPVSFEAGSANPVSPATNSDLALRVAGSTLKGAYTMALYCLAVSHGNGTSTPVINANHQAWPQGISMTRQPLSFDIDGKTVTVSAQGIGNMFHRWLAWLNPKLRPNAYKLMVAGYDCYGVYRYITGKGNKPFLRKGVIRRGK